MGESYTEELKDGINFEMVKVAGGTFKRGKEQQVVTVPDFYIGKYLMTQEVWITIMKENPSRFTGKNHPVERASWDDVQVFLKALYGLTGNKYRLPSEAEWEYAARGGKYSQDLQYAGSNKLKEVGWYRNNSNDQTQPVGLKQANELGIYDMSGNVWEWCADHWHSNYEGAPVNGSPWITGEDKDKRVVRGGSWGDLNINCRLSNRVWFITFDLSDLLGFRLARHCPPEL